MIWFVGSVGYLVLHALLYFTILRTLPAFTSERGAFLYHFCSGVLFTITAAICGLWVPATQITTALAVGTVMLHGVYSLSFLEVWSLTEGGYSLQIMRAIADSEKAGQPLSVSQLEQVGRGKQSSRTGSLEKFGWLSRADGPFRLTPRGRLVATVLYGLRSLVSTRPGQ